MSENKNADNLSIQSQKPTIEVALRHGYGNERFYPINEDAKLLCNLLNSVTLTKKQIKLCRDGGWKTVIQLEDYNLDD
jgi:hypothetical protein